MQVGQKETQSWDCYVCRVLRASIPKQESQVVPTVMQENILQIKRPIVPFVNLESGPEKAGECVRTAKQGSISPDQNIQRKQTVWLAQQERALAR